MEGSYLFAFQVVTFFLARQCIICIENKLSTVLYRFCGSADRESWPDGKCWSNPFPGLQALCLQNLFSWGRYRHKCSYLTVRSDITKQPFCSCFQSESMMTSCIKDIGQVGFNTRLCWYWLNLSLYLCEWFGFVYDLKSGCSAGSAWRVLPGSVPADPGPALPHISSAHSGRTEELHHQKQVSLWCLTICVCLLNLVWYNKCLKWW